MQSNQRPCKWTDDAGCAINTGYLSTYQSRVLTSARILCLINVCINSRLWSLCYSDLGDRDVTGWLFVEVPYHYSGEHTRRESWFEKSRVVTPGVVESKSPIGPRLFFTRPTTHIIRRLMTLQLPTPRYTILVYRPPRLTIPL